MINGIDRLIKNLPEVYQPIYGHPEFSKNASRQSDDRLFQIITFYQALEKHLKRPLKVLDLGCAQGFFGLHLAELGALVHGVDYLNANIHLCNALASEYKQFNISFQTGKVEEVIGSLSLDQYDLVLGLSVFHHIVYDVGIAAVRDLIAQLSSKITSGIFELALPNEPTYWASSQPQIPRELLDGYAFVHKLSQHDTHLSNIQRPLYLASNRYWYLDGVINHFYKWKVDSNILAKGNYQNTRRYFFGEGRVAKIYYLDREKFKECNLQEHLNEKKFLQNPPLNFLAPKLFMHGNSKDEVWLVREELQGELLLDILLNDKSYNIKSVLEDILVQLTALEAAGLYHNDVRVWNVIINSNGKATLIDYGAISKNKNDCTWPYDIFLSFLIFAYEVTMRKVETLFPLRTISISPGRFDQAYKSWISILWSYPISQWSFKLILELFKQEEYIDYYYTQVDMPINLWMKAIEEAINWQITKTQLLAQEFNQWVSQELNISRKKEAELQQKLLELEHQFVSYNPLRDIPCKMKRFLVNRFKKVLLFCKRLFAFTLKRDKGYVNQGEQR